MHDYMTQMMQETQRRAQEAFDLSNPARKVFHSLGENIRDFEAGLDEEHEIGARLVSFGNAVTFHVQNISYSLPSIITFHGITDTGDRVQLVQHVSQLSFLLIAVKKIESTPKRIGFIWD